MPQEKSDVSDFLEVLNGNKEPFQEEVIEQEEEGKDDGGEIKPIPFHKDPKVLKFIEKEVEKRAETFKTSAEKQFRQEVKEELNLPSSFVTLIGNDTAEKQQVLKDLSNYFGSLKGEAKQEFLAEMQEKERIQKAKDDAVANELTSGFEQIEEEYGVDLSANPKQRAAFVDYLRKVSHKNAEGEVDQFADIPATWELFQEKAKPAPASRAKELASRGMTRSTDASTVIPQGRSWKDVDRFFTTLNK